MQGLSATVNAFSEVLLIFPEDRNDCRQNVLVWEFVESVNGKRYIGRFQGRLYILPQVAIQEVLCVLC